MGMSQVPATADEFDLEVTGLSVSQPLVVGEQNTFEATIRNHGRVPLEATVVFLARNADGQYGPVTLQDIEVPARSEVDVKETWDNAQGDPPEPFLSGPVTVRAEVFESREWMVLSVLDALGLSVADITESPELIWDMVWGSASEALDALEEILFEDNQEGRNEWDTARGGTETLRQALADVLFAPHIPDRVDPDPSNNAREATDRLVVAHKTLVEVVTDATGQKLAAHADEEWKTLVRFTNAGTVYNEDGTGDADDVLDLSLEDGTAGWTFSLDKETLALPHSDSPAPQWVQVTMKGPRNAPADSHGTVRLVADSRNAPETGDVDVDLSSPPVETAGDVVVSLAPLEQGVAVGEVATFEFTFVNRQNDDVVVAPAVILPDNGDWADHVSIEPEVMTVEAGQTFDFDVEIEVPASTSAGTYSFNVQAEVPDDDGNGVQQIQAPNAHQLTVLQAYGIRVLEADIDAMVPGELTPVTLTIKNEGNGPDRFAVELIDAPNGWLLRDGQGETEPSFELDAFEEKVAVLSIDAPSTTPHGDQGARFLVTSTASDASYTHHDIVHVEKRILPKIEVGQCPTVGCALGPGEAMTVPLTLRNIGNFAGTLELEVEFEDLESAGWSAEAEPLSATLGPGESVSAELEVESPDPSPGPTAFVDVDLTLAATDQARAGPAWEEALRVWPAFPDLALDMASAATDPAVPYRNLPTDLLVPVANEGASASADFVLEVTFSGPDGSEVDVHEQTVDGLQPGEETIVAVPVPTDAGVAVLSAVVHVDPDEEITEYTIDDNLGEIEIALRTFDMEVTPPSDMSADPGQAISLEGDLGFIVQNAGDRQEVIEVILRAEPAWTQGEWGIDRDDADGVVRISSGGSRSFGTNFFVPEHPESLTAKLTLRVQHAAHETLFVEKSFRVQVADTEPPEIRSFAANPSSVTLGASPNFTAEIWDASGQVDAEVVLKAPDGDTQRLEMTFDEATGLHYGVLPLVVPGQHTWHVWARDASMHVSDTSNAPQTVSASSKSAPLLSLVETGGSSTIRPGTMLAISVSNTTGVKSASIMSWGTTTTLAPTNPIMIPTESWPDGQMSIVIEVVDRFDTQVKRSFTVTVDGTAPTIFDADISHRDPGRSAVVSVRVEDPAGIASVRLRADPGRGAQAEELAMEEANGVYTVEASYPYRDGSLTVIAEDAAGNLASRVIAGDAGGIAEIGMDQGASSLGAVLAVVAFMAVAWHRRHRGGR